MPAHVLAEAQETSELWHGSKDVRCASGVAYEIWNALFIVRALAKPSTALPISTVLHSEKYVNLPPY